MSPSEVDLITRQIALAPIRRRRARSTEWVRVVNFPCSSEGEVDFHYLAAEVECDEAVARFHRFRNQRGKEARES